MLLYVHTAIVYTVTSLWIFRLFLTLKKLQDLISCTFMETNPLVQALVNTHLSGVGFSLCGPGDSSYFCKFRYIFQTFLSYFIQHIYLLLSKNVFWLAGQWQSTTFLSKLSFSLVSPHSIASLPLCSSSHFLLFKYQNYHKVLSEGLLFQYICFNLCYFSYMSWCCLSGVTFVRCFLYVYSFSLSCALPVWSFS